VARIGSTKAAVVFGKLAIDVDVAFDARGGLIGEV